MLGVMNAKADSGRRLLVVDDEPDIVELLSASLRYAGFEVAGATSGRQALADARRFRPELILLDVMMPDLDGIEAVLRRADERSGGEAKGARITFADIELDADTHEVWKAGRPVALSPTEFKLLRYLMENANRVLSKAQILDHVWRYDFGGDGGVVESYVSYLRKKVDTTEPRLIHTMRGVGYVLRLP